MHHCCQDSIQLLLVVEDLSSIEMYRTISCQLTCFQHLSRIQQLSIKNLIQRYWIHKFADILWYTIPHSIYYTRSVSVKHLATWTLGRMPLSKEIGILDDQPASAALLLKLRLERWPGKNEGIEMHFLCSKPHFYQPSVFKLWVVEDHRNSKCFGSVHCIGTPLISCNIQSSFCESSHVKPFLTCGSSWVGGDLKWNCFQQQLAITFRWPLVTHGAFSKFFRHVGASCQGQKVLGVMGKCCQLIRWYQQFYRVCVSTKSPSSCELRCLCWMDF